MHVCTCTCACTQVCIHIYILKNTNTELIQRTRLAWPHRRRGLASDGVRYADAWSSVGRRFRSVTKLRLEWVYGGDFLLLQQRSKHPREVVITPEASTPYFLFPGFMCNRHTRGATTPWPFTRYSFTCRILCMYLASFYCPPPTCIAHTTVVVLHYYCAIYDPPPTAPLHMQYTVYYC